MEMQEKITADVEGTEGIVIHNGNIVLGMQKTKRWYKIQNGETAAIIKTIGGQIEEVDGKSPKKALIREVLEEVKGIGIEDVRVSKIPIFTKKVRMGDLNPYEKQSNLSMNADFYLLEISNKKHIMPNDLPALLEMPIEKFLKLEFCKQGDLRSLQNHIIKNDSCNFNLPEHYALMIPNEVKNFFEKIRGDDEISKE